MWFWTSATTARVLALERASGFDPQGGDWATTHPMAPIESVDWRASEANAAGLATLRDQLTAAGGDPQMIAWANNAVEGACRAPWPPESRCGASANTPETLPTYPVPPENPMMKGPSMS